MPEPPILLGDLIRSRKPHPCGSDTWTVIRTGADIKMKCSGCGRIVMLDRGHVAEEGTYDELMAANGMFADLVKRQQLESE